MGYYARVHNGMVSKVIVAEQDFIDLGFEKSEGVWIKTYKDGVLRKNFASIGYTYDSERDAFIAPKPFNSWLLNEETCIWEAPLDYPDDENLYRWDEETLKWVKI